MAIRVLEPSMEFVVIALAIDIDKSLKRLRSNGRYIFTTTLTNNPNAVWRYPQLHGIPYGKFARVGEIEILAANSY